MARTRALMTETERRQLAGEGEDQRRYEAVSRVRARVDDELTKDLDLLEEHHPQLLQEIRGVVCPGHSTGYDKLGEELEWDKLGPVGPYSVDRLEYVLETLEGADSLAEGLSWDSDVIEGGGLTVEELLGALGEAKSLLEAARENDD